MTAHLRIATRKSDLARWQAHWVSEALQQTGCTTELVLLSSEGDLDQRPITGSDGRGLFTRRIQEALVNNEADVAVHSLKDLPTAKTPGLVLAAVPQREIVNDCLITRTNQSLHDLCEGAVIGTGSRRRCAQLLFHRPDFRCEPIRGNVDTRIRKLDEGQYDAILLAAAGLHRLGLVSERRQVLPLEVMLPAPGQAALGIEIRADDGLARKHVAQLSHAESMAAVTAERVLLADLQGGCLAPIAALAQMSQTQLHLQAVVLSADGRQKISASGRDDMRNAVELGKRVAYELLEQGAAELVHEARLPS